MILLDHSKFDLAINPLKKVTFNTLFAQAVVEQKIEGEIYVDNRETPQTFCISHPYGMSLLFGKTNNDDFNKNFLDYACNTFKVRTKTEWLQVFPDEWNKKLINLFGEKRIRSIDNIKKDETLIEENTRVNFKFNKEKYLSFKTSLKTNNYNILRTDKEMFENMNGSVVPKYFWTNAEQFHNLGVGYSLIDENKIASTAYSAFITENQLEIGIETNQDYRGKGYAIYTCSTLIDYCIEHNYEPIWACRFENTPSYHLAQKLGFEPTLYTQYYRLIH